MRQQSFVSILLCCFVIGCQGPPTGPDPRLSELLAAPTELTFGDVAFQAEVFAWRDFQPGPATPADGKPLAIVVRIGQAFQTSAIERVWVIHDGAVWTAPAEQVPGTTDWVARNGPKWGPGVTVDVVMLVRHPQFGASMLRRSGVLIGRTD